MNKNLQDILQTSRRVVFFGGAGVSTESNIPDFRSEDGLYGEKQQKQYPYPPEIMLSRSFFEEHPREFFEFYYDKMIYPDAEPNAAHRALAELEQQGKLTAVITQNIDGLHQMAGSRNVLELHGSVHRNYCRRCGKEYDLAEMLARRGDIPRCTCGGVIKPDVVLYEEALDMDLMDLAVAHIEQADCLIIGGTSLAVWPAAGLLRYFRGEYLVLINKTPTEYDYRADLIIRDPIGMALGGASLV